MAGEQKSSYGWIIVAVLLVAFFVFVDPSCFFKQPLVAPLVAPFGKWIGGLTELVRPTPTIQPDVATLTQDEVCALVYNYLETRASSVSSIGIRQPLFSALTIGRPYSTATYKGNGKWQVSAMGLGIKVNLYEFKEILQPEERQRVEAFSLDESDEYIKNVEQIYEGSHFPSNQSKLKGVEIVFKYSGQWNLYEATKTIEPANDQATELQIYIQKYTR